MTSAQPMLSRLPEGRTPLATRMVAVLSRVLLAGIAFFMLVSCGRPLVAPRVLAAPYRPTQVWAVAPFANESGVSIADGLTIAEMMAYEAQEVRGVDVIAVNRVLFTMRQLNMPAVASRADAEALMNALHVDALLVGTFTAYDPYPPLTLGLAVQLYQRPDGLDGSGLDPRTLSREPRDDAQPGAFAPTNPVAQAAALFDARNHATLARLQNYAAARHVPESAYGAREYEVSMELFTRFAAYSLLESVLAAEHHRVGPAAPTTAPPA
ncbi:MAG: hypothetical protein KDA25_00290 [Phycisphaerales bacterium]|nr:hypothetical protein [Phycisphaerales bacterium]